MNYIAHLQLSRGVENYIVGNFIADIISNKEYKLMNEELKTGIEFHRFIDNYTDNHPSVREINRFFYPIHGKYSPVISDITMDLCLYTHWNKYNSLQFDIFENQIYDTLSPYIEQLSPKTGQKVQFLLNQRFLSEYITLEGLNRTFIRIKERARFSGNFEKAVETYSTNLKEVDQLFNEFYPELIEICEENYPSK